MTAVSTSSLPNRPASAAGSLVSVPPSPPPAVAPWRRRALLAPALAAVVLLLSLVASPAHPAHAHHFEFTVLDGSKQFDPPAASRVKNFVNTWWATHAVGPFPLWWHAEPEIQPAVEAAISNWTATVPELPWQHVDSPFSADYRFRLTNDTDPPGVCPAIACHRILEWDERSIEDAAYVSRREILLVDPHPEFDPGTNALVGLFAHEIGHLYGLHERYIDDVSPAQCNGQEATIMDDMTVDGAGRLRHCDALQGPASVDSERMDAYWGGKRTSWAPPSPAATWGMVADVTHAVSGPQLTCRWKDLGLADRKHDLLIYYWDGTQWVDPIPGATGPEVFQLIGVNRITEDRTLQGVFDRSFWGTPRGCTQSRSGCRTKPTAGTGTERGAQRAAL